MAVDFRKILIAYMCHVEAMEGVTFIDADSRVWFDTLTDDEYAALVAAEAEDAAHPQRYRGELADVVSSVNPAETPLSAMLKRS